MGRVRREEKKKEDQKGESLRRKEIQVREKVGNSRSTVFFQWFVAPEGRKVGSLKLGSHLARWEMKSCTPLWREAHFQVKMYKTPHVGTTFASWDIEKVHAVVARSTLLSQNAQNTPVSDHFWKLRCRNSARLCGAKHVFKSKGKKHLMFGPLLEVAVVAQRTCRSQNVQSTSCSDHFWKLRCPKSARRCGAKHISKSINAQSATCSRHFWTLKRRFGDSPPCQKWAKCAGFVAFFKNDGGRGTFEEDLQRWISRGRRSTRDMLIRDVRRSVRWFPERGCILEHQIFRFAKMILRDRCSTLYDLASLFRGRHSTLDRWSRKIAKRTGTRPSALHSTFHS